MPSVYITLGLPAAGKSTWIYKNENQFKTIVSADKIKEEMDDYNPAEASIYHEASVKEAANVFKECVNKRIDFCLDGGGVNNNYTYNLVEYAIGNNYKIIIVYFDTPVEVCLKRNEERERKVPVDNIIMKSIRLPKCLFRLNQKADELIHIPYYSNSNIYFDMDGTVAAYQHLPLDEFDSINFIEGEYFRHALPVQCIINKAETLFKNGKNINILSAAPDNGCMKEKVEWLTQYMPFIPEENIHLIGNKVHKSNMLRNILRSKKIEYKDTMMVDDHHDTLVKLNQLGINAVHPSMFLAMNEF